MRQTQPSGEAISFVNRAFTPPAQRDESAQETLRESDRLVAELVAADLVVIGAPMYNFGLPSPLKAWIDNVVRVGVTFGFDRTRQGEPYWPMLGVGKRIVILSSRGDYGYDPGERLQASNLVEPSLKVPLAYLGITEAFSVAIEYDEFSDHRLEESICRAEGSVDDLVDQLLGQIGELAGQTCSTR